MILLNELLEAPDFRRAVNALAEEFRRQHVLGEIHQLGLVTPEVEAAAAELESRSIGPFFIAAGAPVMWRERGEEKKFRGKMGLAYHHGVELELLAPGEGSDFYRSWLESSGAVVVQHLGFLVDDVETAVARLEKEGVPLRIRGRLKAGPLTIDFAYLDTVASAGLVMEVISWRLLGQRFRPSPRLIHGLGRMEKIIGKRSLSL